MPRMNKNLNIKLLLLLVLLYSYYCNTLYIYIYIYIKDFVSYFIVSSSTYRFILQLKNLAILDKFINYTSPVRDS